MVIKIVAVLLLPLSINIEFGDPGWFQYTSAIFAIGSYPYYGDFLPYPPSIPVFLDLMTIGLAIAVCIPGIYFNRWLMQQPREKAVKKMALAAAILTSLITYPLMFSIPFNPYLPVYGGAMVMQAIIPWVVAVFVILPVMGRHGSFIDSDRKAAWFSGTPEALIHEGGIRPGRYTILAYILGVIALCFPNTGYVFTYGGGIGFDSIQVGLITPVWIGSYAQYGMGSGSFYLSMLPSFYGLLFYALCGFSPIFAFSVLQYIQTHVSRMRVFAYAALSILAPYMFFFVVSPFTTVVPIPILLSLGLPSVFLLKQIAPRERLWEDEKVKMWYEKGEDGQELVVVGDQSKGYRLFRPEPIDTVKVPYTYLIISKLRTLRSPNVRSIPETDPTKADWAQAEDPWESSDSE
jgi:hypothetical protein